MIRATIGLRVAAWLLAAPGLAAAAPLYPPFGIDLSAPDMSVRPQDDFYQHVNGAWLARTAIPADKSSYGVFTLLSDRVEVRLHDLLQTQAATAPETPTTEPQKIGAMYAAFMDAGRIEKLGATPIAPLLTAIGAAPDRAALAVLMGRGNADFGASFFNIQIDVDLKDTTHYAIYLGQGGLGMPDRDYYLTKDFTTQRAAYRNYVGKLLTLCGWPDAPRQADAILAMETRIATASWSKADQRDTIKMYNPETLPALAALAPGFPWQALLNGAKLGAKTAVVVNEKTAFPKIAAIYAETDLATLKAWLAFNVADTAAADLSAAFQQAQFDFRDKVLTGQMAMAPRWKRGIDAVAGTGCGGAPGSCLGSLGWAVGKLYVAGDFTPATKARAQSLVANLQAAFHARLSRLDWMGPATKAEALRKLDTYTVKVGYPDHDRSYAGVVIKRDDLVGDVRAAADADWAFYARRSFGPVDRSDWGMSPQTVNAYNGSLRDIVFPAAILQPPFFDPEADPAVNYGAIGAIIGHEMTHGFDDQGRTIDASGALRDWWTPADAAAFKARAAVLGAQFKAFEPLPGLHINPDLTMGENIADLGGVVIALDAYHASLHGQPAPVLHGLTGDQRFFISWAQGWRSKTRDSAIGAQVVSDPHAYEKFRVLGPLPNVDAWYAAFGVVPGDKMYRAPASRARIW